MEEDGDTEMMEGLISGSTARTRASKESKGIIFIVLLTVAFLGLIFIFKLQDSSQQGTEDLSLQKKLVATLEEDVVGRDARIKELQESLASVRDELRERAQHPTVLEAADTLLLDEIPLRDKADLHDPSVANLPPYTLYRTPGEDWVEEARHVVGSSREELAWAHTHVEDPGQEITIVTALFDLGRGHLADVAQFKRDFSEYIARFQRTMNVNYPMVIFMDPHHVSMLEMERHSRGIVIIPWSIKHLADAFPNYFARIEEIRGSPLYRRQAQHTGWLKDSPQAALKYYNLLVMAKPFLLRWAAKLNPWRTQYLMFVDAGHDCVGALKTDHQDLLRHLMGRTMMTFFNYRAAISEETHGMPQRAYRHYIGPPHNDPDTWEADTECCRVVRGGVFGGTPAYIDVFARVYNIALSRTLSDGYMGTEENVMGMVSYRFPDLVNPYENVRDNCDVFVDSGERSKADRSIYVHGSNPDKWNFETRTFDVQEGSYKPMFVPDDRVGG